MTKSGNADNFLDVMTKYEFWENVDWIKSTEIL